MFCSFLMRKVNLEHVRSMICAVRSLGLSTIGFNFFASRSCFKHFLQTTSLTLLSSSLRSPLSSSFLSLLSVSVSLCLSLCDVALVLCLVCVAWVGGGGGNGGGCGWCVWCVCLSVCVGRGRETVCTFKTPSVSRFKTSPCVPAPRAHVFQHVRMVPAHTGRRFESTHRSFQRATPHTPHRTHIHHDHNHSHNDTNWPLAQAQVVF